MEKIVEVTNQLIIDYRARTWCTLPYYGHPKGCPNYNKSPKCPPQVERVEDYFDLSQKHWFAIVDFDLGAHKQKMKKLHPNWTEHQLKCVLYWQGSVRKRLKELCESFLFDGVVYNTIPEAMGVHVINTMQKLGFDIQRQVTKKVYKVALIGYKKEIV